VIWHFELRRKLKMKKSVLSIISSMLISVVSVSIAVAAGTIETPEMKDKIVITETKGIACEYKGEGRYEELEILKELKICSKEELEKLLISEDPEERYLATRVYISRFDKEHQIDLSSSEDWEDIIRKLVIEFYWLMNDGSGGIMLEFARACTAIDLILLEHRTIEYFEKYPLHKYEKESFRGAVMVRVLDEIAKERKDLIPRIKAIVEPSKHITERGLQLTAEELMIKLKTYEKEK
jgi:hypothetical protein